jgi:hypothetical protein
LWLELNKKINLKYYKKLYTNVLKRLELKLVIQILSTYN